MSFQATRSGTASGRGEAAAGRGSGNVAAVRATPGRDKQPDRRKKGPAGSQAGKTSDLDYAKIWFKKFARFHGVELFEQWRFTVDQVIGFLRNEKQGGAPTWKRLKIAESIDLFQKTFFTHTAVDLTTICSTLREHAEKERAVEQIAEAGESDGAPIDESVGLIDPREPELIRELRRALRLQKRELETERAYVKHVQTFMRTRSLDSIASCANIGPKDVEAFLTDKAVRGNVSESTQDQAFYALLFLFQHVLKREMGCIDAVRSTKPKRVPTVMSHDEVAGVLGELRGVYLLIAQILYGAGLRLSECLRLRTKDIDFDQMQIVVRHGKGKKDRLTPLPNELVEPLKKLLRQRQILHDKDVDDGTASVWLPRAIGRKYPNAHREFKWQYLFASAKLSKDPRTGRLHRHHLHKGTFPTHLGMAVKRAGVNKLVTSHTFRHSFATHLLIDGADIRTVQELLGHADVKTTMIYLHVMNRVDVTVRSPLDRLVARQANNRRADSKSSTPPPRLAASCGSVDRSSVRKGDACMDAPVILSSSGGAAICDQPIDVVIERGLSELELPWADKLGADRLVASCWTLSVAFVAMLLSLLVAGWRRVSHRLRNAWLVSSAMCSPPIRLRMRIAERSARIRETGLTSSSGAKKITRCSLGG